MLNVGVEFLNTLEGLFEAAEWEKKRRERKGKEENTGRDPACIGKKTWWAKLQMFKAEYIWVSAEWSVMWITFPHPWNLQEKEDEKLNPVPWDQKKKKKSWCRGKRERKERGRLDGCQIAVKWMTNSIYQEWWLDAGIRWAEKVFWSLDIRSRVGQGERQASTVSCLEGSRGLTETHMGLSVYETEAP